MRLFHLTCVFVSIASTLFFSCEPHEPPASFNEPQPTNFNNLSRFPKRLCGQYLSQEDHSIVSIGEKLIIKTNDFEFKFHPNQIDSNSGILGDTLINYKTNEKNILKRDGDSLITHVSYIDTLFQIDSDNVVRKYKGYYFLNTRFGDSNWEVKKIHLTKNQLIIARISSKQDIELLKEITTPNDTFPPYNFSPTRRQFKEFIKKQGFQDQEVLLKLSTTEKP